MLSSSDAKWKCLWYLFVWSIQLTLVSQFLSIKDHVAFYIFATISVLILPVLTAIYSNTAGRHGSGLLRFGLVFCDPVLACLSVTPVLLLNKMPQVIDEYKCYQFNSPWNSTYECIINKTDLLHLRQYQENEPSKTEKDEIFNINRTQFLIIQMSIMFPVILVFLMGRRSRKMKFTTYIFGFAYWFIAALESACLLEIVLLGNQYEPTIFTTEAIICIAMIVTNSYAIVTLCSYINPVGLMDNKNTKNKFDFLYSIFFAVSGILFAEIPMLVARCQILSANVENILPGTFYIWLMKDILWLVLIAILVYVQRFGHKYLQLPCKPKHSNKHLYFEPEKRDVYINRYRHSLYQQPSEMDKLSNSSIKDKNLVFNDIQLKKCISEPNIYTCNKSEAAKIISSSSKSNNDIDTVGRCSIEEDIYINDFYSKPFTKKLINGESKTYNTKQENKKHVTFKLELGMGRFLQMKPRSDSPPVYHIETDHIIPD